MSTFISRIKTIPVLIGLCLLAACGSSPKVQYFQLRAEPPPSVEVGALVAPASPNGIWALGPVQIPEYLDRDAIVRPSGLSTLNVQPTERWAEPLRDAIPRLLQQDLARLLGAARIWRLPLPPGLKAERQLRVDIQRLDAETGGPTSVVLQARWILIDPSGRTPPQVLERRFTAPVLDSSTDSLVAAHRMALWDLALAVANSP